MTPETTTVSVAAPPPLTGLFSNLDWQLIGYAAGMAAIMSLLTILRARNIQKATGLPLSSWLTMFPDIGLGTIIGTLAAWAIPEFIKPLRSAVGVLIIAGIGGITGPRATDWISANGWNIFLKYLGMGSSKLGKALEEQKGDDDGSKNHDTP